MNFRRLFFALLLVFESISLLFAQPRFFLLTTGPGNEAYELYGHSAFRITDSTEAVDLVVDWGVFDFNQPDFYLNFALGKMLYTTGCWNTEQFIQSVAMGGKSLISQEILLNPSQNERLITLIKQHLLPENRDYYYDFIFENCATRPRDLLETALNTDLIYADPADSLTFREIINHYQIEKGWYNLLINTILGSKLDRIATHREQMFIPDYLQRNLSTAIVNDSVPHPLLDSPQVLVEVTPRKVHDYQNVPLYTFSIICVLLFFLDIGKKLQKPIRIFTYFFFSILLIISFLMIFLWGFTDHQSTYWNWNLLWANPLLIFPFIAYIRRQRKSLIKWTMTYYIFFLIAWAAGFIPQSLPAAVAGIVLLILERCYFSLSDFTKKR